MHVKRIGDWTLEDRLAEGGRPLVVLFFRSDPGKAAIPQDRFQRLADAYPEARFYEVDLLENPSLEARFSITTAPTTLVFVEGVEKGRIPGARLEHALRGLLGPSTGD